MEKPNHPTFSDESVYSGIKLPDGRVAVGGHWEGDTFTPSETNDLLYGIDNLVEYMKKYEPYVTITRKKPPEDILYNK